MSKAPLLSFEKNNYYYGKLLTVRDFQLEQQYGVAKQRLINRLVIGSGVVSGLQVDKVGGRGIRITPGVAIDGNGAEIVVSREVVQSDIKELAGYPLEGEGNKTVYLALRYEECTREPIPALANTSGCQEICEANRIVETFKAELTPTPPAAEPDLHDLLDESTVLYQGTKLKLERIVPRFVSPQDSFEVTVRLTALQPIASTESFELQLHDTVPELFSYLKHEMLQFFPGAAAAGTVWKKTYTIRAGGQTGSGVIAGQLSVYDNGSRTVIDAAGSTVEIIGDEELQRKIVELAFGRLDESGASEEENGRVIIAAITIDGEGLITNIDESSRSYVYNNRLLGRLTALGGSLHGKLPGHAVSHQHGGSDPINVDNLPGELADPQKVMVYTDGDNYVKAKRFSFSGSGVTVEQAGDDHVNVNIAASGGGSGGGPHAASHQAGGSDPINVTGMPGVLKEPQKISVWGRKEDGSSFGMQANAIFIDGVEVKDAEGSAYVNIPKHEVITGSVLFENLGTNVIYKSYPINVDAKGKAIVFYFEAGDGVVTANDFSGFQAWADFKPGTNYMIIYSRHIKEGQRLTWRVRYYLIPATTDLGEVGSGTIMN
ncbi:hypothetical protein ACFSL6_14030 [Paenibacillus thailandensis]|uniref:Uncharacterized protein n=1 Tax=Paenibacillus thailandensis TaxID=393250 RepID=A0ABW5QY80_9BACL